MSQPSLPAGLRAARQNCLWKMYSGTLRPCGVQEEGTLWDSW